MFVSKPSKPEASTEASKDALVRNGADFVTFKLQFMESSQLRPTERRLLNPYHSKDDKKRSLKERRLEKSTIGRINRDSALVSQKGNSHHSNHVPTLQIPSHKIRNRP